MMGASMKRSGVFGGKAAVLAGTALAMSLPVAAHAGDKVLVAPVPAWVVPSPEPAPAAAAGGAKAQGALPRFDEQAQVDGATVTAFIDTTTLISSPEVLNQRGTISVNWQPSQGDVTFHRIDIIRDGKVIDGLQNGAGFTVLRREAGLERMSVNGALTAVKHLEDLQVGDRLRVSFSISGQDPVLKGNAQDALVMIPGPTRLEYGRARLIWRTERPLFWKSMVSGVTPQQGTLPGGWSELTVPLPIAKLPDLPKNMPTRFQAIPLIMFTTFADWKSVAATMAPLYAVKDTITAGGDLDARVQAIAKRTSDPVARMAAALQLVQDDVRYQLIAMGTGNYVPQKPEDTWAKRYGDCKAKTVLLLAILERLGITAEPVLANIQRGDAVESALPSAMAFDHVFVRARVGEEDFWLDGTMMGSRIEDIRDVPRYGKVLPLYTGGGALLDLPRRANARMASDVGITYDMTAGPHLPSPYALTIRFEGPAAARNRVQPNANYDDELTKFVERQAESWTGSNLIGDVRATYDADKAVWTVATEGVVYLNWTWSDGHYNLPLKPSLRVVYDAPRDRAAWRTIPALIVDPWTARARSTFVLPDGGKGVSVTGDLDRRIALPVVAWQRHVTVSDGRLTEDIESRETGVEVPPEAISATGKTITETLAGLVHVDLAPTYPQKWIDVPARQNTAAMKRARAILDARITAKPDDAARLADRAGFRRALLDYAGAEEDYGKAITIDASAARYLARSYLRTRRSDHAGALADARAAYDLEDGNSEARNQLAKELANADKVDDAMALLPAEPDPTTDDGLQDALLRIEVLETGNRHDDALGYVDSLVEKRPRSAELRNARCWFLALRNQNLEQAMDDCSRAIELSSDPATYLDSRGMVHYRAGRFTEAAADYAGALAESPDIPSSLFMSGIVARKLGKKAEGDAAIAAARRIYPEIDHFYARYGITA